MSTDREIKTDPRIVATYDYCNEDRDLLYQIVRKEPGKNGRAKDFSIRRPNGNGGWIWNRKNVRLVLYRLAELQESDGPVVIVEGEKCVDCLHSLGIRATCNPFGAGKWRDEYRETLRGCDVTLWPDADKAGGDHMERLAQSLYGHAASIRVVKPPAELDEKGDAADGIQKLGWSLEEVTRIIESAEAWEPKSKAVDPEERLSGIYRIEDGRIGYMKKVGRGDDVSEMFVPLCNFVAEVIEEQAVDDGEVVVRHFEISGKTDDGRSLPKIEVPTTQFNSMRWVVDQWGIKARLSAGYGATDKLREAIQINSADAQVTHTYAHTGWRNIDGKRRYLHAGRSDVVVSLEPPLDRYALPINPTGVVEAVRCSLSLLEVAPLDVSVPLIAVIYLAPLCEILHPDFVVFLVGKTGSLKSTLAALFLSHYGSFVRTGLSASWESTDNALERRLFILKDTVCVVDDFAPSADPIAQRKQVQKAQRIIRSMGNLSGRSRLRANLSARRDYVPRGLMVSTGEDLPPGQSILARALIAEVEKERLDLTKLTLAQENTERLPHAMAGYIEWLEPRMDELENDLKIQWREHRTRFNRDGGHLRIPEILAYLALGMDLFTSFARDLQVMSENEIALLSEQTFAALTTLGETHSKRVNEEDPTEVFLDTLSAMLVQARVSLMDRDTLLEPDNMIGWSDSDYAYLIPDAARHAVGRYLREAGGHFPHSARALYSALTERGAIVRGKDGRSTTQAKINGRNRRVLQIPKNFLEPAKEGEHEGRG